MNNVENGKNIAAVAAGTPSGIQCHAAGKTCGQCGRCGRGRWPDAADWGIPALAVNPAAAADLVPELEFLLTRAQPRTDDEWVTVARFAAGCLAAVCPEFPAHLRQVAQPHGPAAALVTGLPVGDADADWGVARLVTLACATVAGESFEYAQQAGELLSKLVKSSGLGQHCDDGLMPAPCRAEMIGLFGAANATDALTTVTPIAPAALALDAATRGVLLEPRFRLKGPPGLKLHGHEIWSEPTPVLFHDEAGGWTARLTIREGCRAARADDAEAAAALDGLFAKLNSPAWLRAVCLRPGMFLLVANARATHSRVAATRAGERLLFRTLIRGDLAKLGPSSAPGSRVFNAGHALARE